MAPTKDLSTLFHDTLEDVLYAERHVLKALPKLAKGASNQKLKDAFLKHRDQTETQIERLEKVFELIEKSPRAKKCDAIEGILAEGDEILKEYKGSEALDAGLIAAAQAVEHYEITRYGTLRRWAATLGLSEAEKLLKQTLDEESDTDEALTKLAADFANKMALQAANAETS